MHIYNCPNRLRPPSGFRTQNHAPSRLMRCNARPGRPTTMQIRADLRMHDPWQDHANDAAARHRHDREYTHRATRHTSRRRNSEKFILDHPLMVPVMQNTALALMLHAAAPHAPIAPSARSEFGPPSRCPQTMFWVGILGGVCQMKVES